MQCNLIDNFSGLIDKFYLVYVSLNSMNLYSEVWRNDVSQSVYLFDTDAYR